MRNDLLTYAKMFQYGLGYIAGQLEVTSDCDQQCAFCQSWRDHQSGKCNAVFTEKQFVEVLNQLNLMPYFENLTLTGGEPQCWIPLENFMYWRSAALKFKISINTTLAREINLLAWRKFHSIRVSLDSLDKDTYKSLRGVDLDPMEIIERLERLDHTNWSSMTCVSQKNLNQIPHMLDIFSRMKCPPRKSMFLPALGDYGLVALDMQKYATLKTHVQGSGSGIPTNFGEDVKASFAEIDLPAVPCYIGASTFHIKANGDVYPCCLLGGEAVSTEDDYKIGNVHKENLDVIQRISRIPAHRYLNSDSPCRKICQWKQCYMNVESYKARLNVLSMP